MKTARTKPEWIAVDWGTTHLRTWLMSDDGQMLERRNSDQGMGCLERDQFAPVLNEMLKDILAPMPVIICGMAGSRQGWAEAPYVATPCPPPGIANATRIDSGDLSVNILPGIKQLSPADVMRGEETQIAGFLSTEPDYEGILCLPGTHTKWVKISSGQITNFRTFMTGELYSLISNSSVLRHAVVSDDWDQDAFDTQLSQSLTAPQDMAGILFSLRAEGLLYDLSPAIARARLSAVLIGTELCAARSLWQKNHVVILGEGSVAHAYQSALAAQGIPIRLVDAEEMTLAGLKFAYQQLQVTHR